MKSSTVHNLTEVDRLGPDPGRNLFVAQKNTSWDLGFVFCDWACMIVYVNIDTAILFFRICMNLLYLLYMMMVQCYICILQNTIV